MKTLIVIFAIIFISGCASKPRLYPNAKLQKVGKAQSQRDVDFCMERADEFLGSSQGRKFARGAGFGAIVGGATGAISGIFTGDVIGEATRGAAIGGTAGGTANAMTPDEVKRRFVNKCLADKGYEVIGWN